MKVPESYCCPSLTVSVQSPSPLSPQLATLSSVNTGMSPLVPPQPGLASRRLTVPSGDVRSTVRSPTQLWSMSRVTVT